MGIALEDDEVRACYDRLLALSHSSVVHTCAAGSGAASVWQKIGATYSGELACGKTGDRRNSSLYGPDLADSRLAVRDSSPLPGFLPLPQVPGTVGLAHRGFLHLATISLDIRAIVRR